MGGRHESEWVADMGRNGWPTWVGIRNHNLFCAVIARFAADPEGEIIEYLRRDILNAALRNTDNHSRNTAFLKPSEGTAALSPLYDFAPMFLDPEGIARSSRWGDDLEPKIGRPLWGKIAESLAPRVEAKKLRALLARDAEPVERLPETLRECGVEDHVIEKVARRCAEIAEDLLDAGPRG